MFLLPPGGGGSPLSSYLLSPLIPFHLGQNMWQLSFRSVNFGFFLPGTFPPKLGADDKADRPSPPPVIPYPPPPLEFLQVRKANPVFSRSVFEPRDTWQLSSVLRDPDS